MSEKREYKRIPESISIEYQIISLGENPTEDIKLRGPGISGNISEGGILFKTDKIIPLGTFLELEINIPEEDNSPLFIKGRVVRVEELPSKTGYDIGFHFTLFLESDKETLIHHLGELEKGC